MRKGVQGWNWRLFGTEICARDEMQHRRVRAGDRAIHTWRMPTTRAPCGQQVQERQQHSGSCQLHQASERAGTHTRACSGGDATWAVHDGEASQVGRAPLLRALMTSVAWTTRLARVGAALATRPPPTATTARAAQGGTGPARLWPRVPLLGIPLSWCTLGVCLQGPAASPGAECHPPILTCCGDAGRPDPPAASPPRLPCLSIASMCGGGGLVQQAAPQALARPRTPPWAAIAPPRERGGAADPGPPRGRHPHPQPGAVQAGKRAQRLETAGVLCTSTPPACTGGASGRWHGCRPATPPSPRRLHLPPTPIVVPGARGSTPRTRPCTSKLSDASAPRRALSAPRLGSPPAELAVMAALGAEGAWVADAAAAAARTGLEEACSGTAAARQQQGASSINAGSGALPFASLTQVRGGVGAGAWGRLFEREGWGGHERAPPRLPTPGMRCGGRGGAGGGGRGRGGGGWRPASNARAHHPRGRGRSAGSCSPLPPSPLGGSSRGPGLDGGGGGWGRMITPPGALPCRAPPNPAPPPPSSLHSRAWSPLPLAPASPWCCGER